MKIVLLIGTSHKYQLPGTPAADEFRTFIKQVCSKSHVRAVAEEMSREALSQKHVLQSVCEEISITLGIHHRYCDLDNDQRNALGVQQKNNITMDGWLANWSPEKIQHDIEASNSIREQYWLKQLFDLNRWPALFVCGACHTESFGRLAEEQQLSVDLIVADWTPG